MDTLLLSRLQFAVTICFHFLFPPISIGLAWLLVWVEWRGWRQNDELFVKMGKFFSHLLALTFAVGVATGIVMEFEFGTNWSRYSKFVGDIFGAPLAAEAIFAFFLESSFLGLYLFGRNKVSKGVHWFACLMVAVGATISAFWILVAGSWMQTPAGYTFNEQLGRAELTDFAAAVFNPSLWPRFLHTIVAALVAGSFFMAGIAAYLVRKNKEDLLARKALTIGLVMGLICSLLSAYPTGHDHARQVARDQPEKFAAMEGLYTTQTNAPLAIFGLVYTDPPRMKYKIEIPGLLSWMAFGDVNREVQGIDQCRADEIPPLWLTFVSFHNMVILGTYFILLMGLGCFKLIRGTLWSSRKFLYLLIVSLPLPLVAIQFGWVTAEVGRQPWIVYKLLRTSEAFSPTVPSAHILLTLIMFTLIYLCLLGLYIYLLLKMVRKGPEPATVKEVRA